MTVTTETEAYRRALDLEPDLQAVEAMVRALAALAPTDEPFCSSCLWEDVLKPLVSPMVGWDRHRPHIDATPPRNTWEPIDLTQYLDDTHKPAEPTTPEEAWLRTDEAYDAVTDPLLALLDTADPGLGHGYPGKVRNR